jgi:hypothetical protein
MPLNAFAVTAAVSNFNDSNSTGRSPRGRPVILPDLWPMALFMMAVVALAVWCYREALD